MVLPWQTKQLPWSQLLCQGLPHNPNTPVPPVLLLNRLRNCRCAHLGRFKELRDYVLARRDALGGGSKGKQPSIMDLDLDDATALKKSGKGFA